MLTSIDLFSLLKLLRSTMRKIPTLLLFILLSVPSTTAFGVEDSTQNTSNLFKDCVKNYLICNVCCHISELTFDVATKKVPHLISYLPNLNSTYSTAQTIISGNPIYPPILIVTSACFLMEGIWHLIKMGKNVIDLDEKLNKN